ncbi:tetratricopeptide repeat protein [Methylobacter tundripaludum]|uniref:Tetratricopeptide repeat protein n=1 Tax=Methylobacter tundripaludum TaxID=173365 RepID=A0A2S6HJP5_9GAMM|nr:response regulator [Methylobacter tundripaludum]PPK77718.1 tetratricopeptide repeat protein [Methylobacter tundripaludum]
MKMNFDSKKILVIEDQAIIRETIKHILYSLGVRHIVEAGTGVNGIVEMRRSQFDIVLCDYNLGDGKNGQQVLEEAKHFKLLSFNAVFIMITVEQSKNMVLSALDCKPDDYLIKPFNRLQLSTRIERCIVRKEYLASIEREIDIGNIYQAIQNCEKLLQQGNKKTRLHVLKIRADLALVIRDFKAAKKIYQEILQERDIPWAKLGMIVIVFFDGNYEQAVESLQQFIGQYPMMLEAYDWLAKSYEALGNNEEALITLNLAIDLSPQTILRQQRLALLADKTENIEVAKKAYKAAVNLGKHSVYGSSSDFSGLAKAHLKSNSAGDALKILNDMNKCFFNDPDSRLRAAILEIEIQKAKNNGVVAQKPYEKAFKLNEQFGKQIARELRLEMAKISHLSGASEMTDEILADLIKTNIDDKCFIGEIDKMCNAFIGDNYANDLISRIKQELVDINNEGVNLFKEGRIKDALAIFEDAVEKMPNNQAITLSLLKIIIHDLKTSKPDPKKTMLVQSYINKAIKIGVPHDQIGSIQLELDKIQYQNPLTQKS